MLSWFTHEYVTNATFSSYFRDVTISSSAPSLCVSSPLVDTHSMEKKKEENR